MKKTSPIWNLSKEDFQKLVDESYTYKEVLNKCGLFGKGDNYETLRNRFEYDNINLENLCKNRNSLYKNCGGRNKGPQRPDSEIFSENSNYSRCGLKRVIKERRLLEDRCNSCGIGPEWNGQKLSLQIDHKNGVSNDNRLENLQILCPNCHSQTHTFAGRNSKKEIVIVKSLELAKSEIIKHENSKSKRKIKYKILKGRNGPRLNRRKVERPSKEELEKLLWEKPTTVIAKEYGVSDIAVSKWAKTYGIKKPGRGYWGFG